MLNGYLLFIAGVTIFLFSMIKLSSVSQEMLSARIRNYIVFSVKRPLYGLITGIVATILLQSSSATTLLTVGIVSAGLISFFHSLGIILGADIATTLTAQLVVWKVTTFSPVIIFCGGLLWFIGKEKTKLLGEAILYFGLIFFGLTLVGDATEPLKSSPLFIKLFQESPSPLFGFAAGIAFTIIVQASAIPISILVILASQGLVTIEGALPIVFGANIGTTITAVMGGAVANTDGKRTALAHILFKVFGVLLSSIFFPFFVMVIRFLSSNPAQQIAFSHFLLNFLIVSLFIFLLRPFSTLITKIVPGKTETIPIWPEFLDKNCLNRADEALLCVQKELKRELALTEKMFRQSLDLIQHYDERIKRDISYIELVVDNLQAEITKFLWNTSCSELTPALSKRLFAYTATVYDIERVADHSMNIMALSEHKSKRNAAFSEPAKAELTEINNLILNNLHAISLLLDKKDVRIVEKVIRQERQISIQIRTALSKHLERFHQKVCPAEAGPIFVEMLINLERTSEHIRLIAEHIHALEE